MRPPAWLVLGVDVDIFVTDRRRGGLPTTQYDPLMEEDEVNKSVVYSNYRPTAFQSQFGLTYS